MVGTSENKLNKIRKEMEHDNKEVHAHDGVDTSDLPLQVKNRVGRQVVAVDREAWAWYDRVKEDIDSASIDMKTVLSNFPNEDIHKRIEINENNNFGSSEGSKSED